MLSAAIAVMGLTSINAQEDLDFKRQTISLDIMTSSEMPTIGITYERPTKKGTGNRNSKSTSIINFNFAGMNYEAPLVDVTGSGVNANIGIKTYHGKKGLKGFYTANYLSAGHIKFDEGFFDGKYRYFSFFSPELGYKFELGRFTIDPVLGTMWTIEIKGKGDVDNKYIDNWIHRFGIRLGYKF